MNAEILRIEGEISQLEKEWVAIYAKARLWDALENLDGDAESRIRLMTGLKLAEAVKAAMKSEGSGEGEGQFAPADRPYRLESRQIMETTQCCGDWPRYWLSFQWMTTEDNTMLRMPYVGRSDVRHQMRINYCPACGADVRDCIVSRERFREVMEAEDAR